MNGNNIIAKRNNLVSKAAYNLENLEHLIFLSALSEVDSREQITDKNEYIINIPQLIKTANLTSTSVYTDLKKAAQRLRRREISIPQENGSILVTGFIQSYIYHDKEAKLSICFSTKIIPYISHIRETFVSYKFKQIAKFKSNYSVRLYELLIQRLDISNVQSIEIETIRKLFQLSSSYSRYSNFIIKVIIPAIKDINTHSDINIIYKEIRTGRKVTALEFHIEALEPRPTTKKQIEQEALPGETYSQVKERLKEEKEPKKTPFWKKLFK